MRPAPRSAAPPPGYRPDIDGLRAIAVLGVILFHYGFGPASGGFVGVDVFFVISGFLITSIVRTESRQGGFSLAGFAERRLRRILPALLVTLAASCVACATLLPNDLKSVGTGLITAATFTSNLFFVSLADDYFAAGALGIQPALHTWSLAVEAQFYVVVALVWAAGRRWPRGLGLVLAVAALASFAASLWGVVHRPAAAFYLLPDRFWEFMVGAALTLAAGTTMRPGLAQTLVAAGLGLIGAAFVVISPATPFPGLAALPPCLGAALVVAGGGVPNPLSRLIATRPMAAAGRLSYTLYLWHWPVLVFAAYGHPAPLPVGERVALLALAGLLAFATSRLIERPLIERRWLARRLPFGLACAAGLIGTAGLGLVVNLAGQNLVPLARLPDAVLTLANGQFDTVDIHCPVGAQDRPDCRFGAADVTPSVALWGDSFARMWVPGLDAAARRHGAAGIDLLMNKCPPLIGTAFPALRDCAAFNAAAMAVIAARPELRTVLVAARWSDWTAQLSALRATLAALVALGRRPIVILAPPAAPYPVPRALALAALRGTPPPSLLTPVEARSAQAPLDAVLGGDGATAIATIDPFPAFCTSTCRVEQDGRSLYYDEVHVSRFGAALAAPIFDPAFAPSPSFAPSP